MSDELAIGAVHAAEARGIGAQRDPSVIGFDDTPAAANARPALSTVAQHEDKPALGPFLLRAPA